jgi:HupE / UreJ protein
MRIPSLASLLAYQPRQPYISGTVRRTILTLLAVCLAAVRADAHPAPFSYLDLRLGDATIDGTLVLHVVDVAHDLQIASPESLLDPATAAATLPRLVGLLRDRMSFQADGHQLGRMYDGVDPLPDRHAVRLRFRLVVAGSTAQHIAQYGALTMRLRLFPYDPVHQTFVNVYDGGALRYQGIFDRGRDEGVYYTGSTRGALAVIATFVPAGVHHILIGPDHILFLVGLLLLGGGVFSLFRIVTAFTIGHSLTLSLAALDLVAPSSRLVEPAIALSIVFVGADNLLVKREGGRDVRLWIALVFGFVHGFGFASVLKEFGLPREALGWSLFSFNVGVEIGQLVIVAIVASLLAFIRRYSVVLGQRLATAGSIVVIAAGAYWFIERVFFTGGV